MNLPIEPAIPKLREALNESKNTILIAEPGAGKTTRVPLALLDEPWLEGRKILMLEPRRLAARSAARYMAATLGEQVGETVGYRVKLDTRVGPKTRIEVITEGVLTRLLQADPALDGVGLVIFDEFHERSLHADLGLALTLQSQEVLREDLRILVMSATMDEDPIADVLGNASVVRSEGRAYPVTTQYADRRPEGRVEPAVMRTVLEALSSSDGDLLVFLPGAGEIRRVAALLAEARLNHGIRVAPLYGGLSPEEQDQAIAPCAAGERKIVLATSIAETSLTVEGVKVVIDSGLMRVPRFSPRTGMTRLETVPVSRAAADQRRGRAGRLGPGVCYRLWNEQEERQLPAHTTAEIREADLAPLLLELAVWGVSDPTELRWLDAPPAPAVAQARELLQQLGALDAGGAVTAHGRSMAALGLHPRLAHMLRMAQPLGHGALACELAALLGERDIVRGDGAAPDADVAIRIAALRAADEGQPRQGAAGAHRYAVDAAACRRVRAEARELQRQLGLAPSGGSDGDSACGLLLAFAYPDRIAQRRSGGRFLLRNGRGSALPTVQPLSSAPYLVAAELDDQGAESRVWLAAPISLEEIEQHHADQIEAEDIVAWDTAAEAVRARRRVRLGALVLKETPLPDPDPDAMLEALLQGTAALGIERLPWTRNVSQYRQRMSFMHHYQPEEWPDVSDAALLASLAEWLGPHCYGLKSRAELERLQLTPILESMLSWSQRQELDEQAPTHITVPSGSRIPVDYSDIESPVLAVRLQEMFGLQNTPRIAGGKVALTIHLLSPAQRPVQVTRDLASFWREAYFEVRKDLKGRYPKHHWPDDPLAALPTNRAKPRGQ